MHQTRTKGTWQKFYAPNTHQEDFVKTSTHLIRTKKTLFKYQCTKYAPNGLCWNINTSNTHLGDFVHIHQLTNYASKRLNEERMHQKYENIGCYKHIHNNCFPNYYLDDSIQDEKKKLFCFLFCQLLSDPLKHPWKKNVGLHWNTTEKIWSMQPVLKHHLYINRCQPLSFITYHYKMAKIGPYSNCTCCGASNLVWLSVVINVKKRLYELYTYVYVFMAARVVHLVN